MKNLGFLRISFTEWRYCLTEILSITIQVPSGRIDEATCLKKVYYSVDKHAGNEFIFLMFISLKFSIKQYFMYFCILLSRCYTFIHI